MTAMLSSRASRFLATRDLLNKMQETDYGLTYCGGEGGSRTLGTRKGSLDFESSTFGHSVTSPKLEL